MHERNGAQLVCLAAFGALSMILTLGAMALRGAMPRLSAAGALFVSAFWMIWLDALVRWVRSVRVARARR